MSVVERQIAHASGRVLVLLGVSVGLELLVQLLPPHYSPIADSESALAIGPYGWIEAVSFCLRGGMVFLLLHTARLAIPPANDSRLGDALLAAVAASKFVIAFVPADLTPRPETVHGAIHALVAFAAFFAAAIGEVLVAKKVLALAWMPAQLLLQIARITIVWSVAITVGAGMGLPFWGALERIETVLLLGWIALFAAALRQHALGMVWRWG